MASAAAITTEVDSDTLALVDQVALTRGMTRAEFAAEAVRRVAESEADFAAFIREGVEAVKRGETVPHAEVMLELEQMIERHQVRCSR